MSNCVRLLRRTLIRSEMVAHVYDSTYGLIKKDADTLVVLDDSIVRGTTLKQSILKILDRLGPKKIVVVSSAPQIRYPDCYGIDMSRMGEFVAFEAAISLLKESGQEDIILKVYQQCKESASLPKEDVTNYVKAIYEPFTDQQISDRIAKIITPANINCKVEVIYQTLDNLHKACPGHAGDWYFLRVITLPREAIKWKTALLPIGWKEKIREAICRKINEYRTLNFECRIMPKLMTSVFDIQNSMFNIFLLNCLQTKIKAFHGMC